MKKNVLLIGVGLIIFLLASAILPAQAQKKSKKLNDAEIASIAVTANQIDINAAELAKSRTKNSEVSNFAQTMITDHTSVINQAVALVKKLKVTPQDNAVSRQLHANAKKTLASLKAKKSTSFDKAYASNEVAYHKAVISTVENTLIPQAQNAELKSLLQSVLPVLKTHLAHAEMVVKNLK
jgi:Predicted outer membrane protein